MLHNSSKAANSFQMQTLAVSFSGNDLQNCDNFVMVMASLCCVAKVCMKRVLVYKTF